MSSYIYYGLGAAAGLAEGYLYGVEQLLPGGATLVHLVGFDSSKQKGALLDKEGIGDQEHPSLQIDKENQAQEAASSRRLRPINSFPVDDLATYGSTGSIPDTEAAAQDLQDHEDDHITPATPPAPGGLRVPKLKLQIDQAALDVAMRADTIQHGTAGASLAGPVPARGQRPGGSSQLTLHNVSPLNAAFEAARSSTAGAVNEDSITIATTNRYTYGLGPSAQVGGTALTPRSEAAASEPPADIPGVTSPGPLAKKRRGLLGRLQLRRKGDGSNQQLR